MSEKDQIEIVPDLDDLQPLEDIESIEKPEPEPESKAKPEDGEEFNDEDKIEKQIDVKIEDSKPESTTRDNGHADEEPMEVSDPISADSPTDVAPENGNKMDEESHTV